MPIHATAAVNGGAPQSGAITLDSGDSVQFGLSSYIGVGVISWEIYSQPDEFDTPSGWTAGQGRIWWQGNASTGLVPPSVDFTGAPWGKYLVRCTVNNGLSGSAIDLDKTRDESLVLQLAGPIEDVAPFETDQFDNVYGIWGSIRKSLRHIADFGFGTTRFVDPNHYATFAEAESYAAANGLPIYITPGTHDVEATIATSVDFVWHGGRLRPASGVSVTLNGHLSAPSSVHVFDSSLGGAVFVYGEPFVYPQWWGDIDGDWRTAILAAEASANLAGAVTVYENGTYSISGNVTVSGRMERGASFTGAGTVTYRRITEGVRGEVTALPGTGSGNVQLKMDGAANTLVLSGLVEDDEANTAFFVIYVEDSDGSDSFRDVIEISCRRSSGSIRISTRDGVNDSGATAQLSSIEGDASGYYYQVDASDTADTIYVSLVDHATQARVARVISYWEIAEDVS